MSLRKWKEDTNTLHVYDPIIVWVLCRASKRFVIADGVRRMRNKGTKLRMLPILPRDAFRFTYTLIYSMYTLNN